MPSKNRPRIVETYLAPQWHPAAPDTYLDVPTARLLFSRGITMVRLREGLLARMIRAKHPPRDISLARYLERSQPPLSTINPKARTRDPAEPIGRQRVRDGVE